MALFCCGRVDEMCGGEKQDGVDSFWIPYFHQGCGLL